MIFIWNVIAIENWRNMLAQASKEKKTTTGSRRKIRAYVEKACAMTLELWWPEEKWRSCLRRRENICVKMLDTIWSVTVSISMKRNLKYPEENYRNDSIDSSEYIVIEEAWLSIYQWEMKKHHSIIKYSGKYIVFCEENRMKYDYYLEEEWRSLSVRVYDRRESIWKRK